MRQFLRKRALVAVLSAIALVGMSQPAAAGPFNPNYITQVTPNGVGDLLIFGYWTTDDRDSLVSITNAFGAQTERFVHVTIYEGVNSAELLNFTICLSPGDVWTAAISSDGANSIFTVGNPGTCDESVTGSLTPPLASGDSQILNANFGYIVANTMECTSTFNCPFFVAPNFAPAPPAGDNDGGDDTIMGTATLVSPTTGFSSSYNATSLIGFDALDEGADIHNGDNVGRAHGTYPTVVPGGTSNTNGSARTDVANALANEGGVAKELLMGRWTAATSFNSSTDVVLTFPTGDYPGAADPVSIWIFDEEERRNFSPRAVILDYEVNLCRFQNADQTASGLTEFYCNGVAPAGGPEIQSPVDFQGGWFRIINNNDLIVGIGDGTGVESNNIDRIPDTAFPVIGLIFSFFEGINGIFDQAYGIQWAAITGLGGIGDPVFCSVFPYTNCNAFNITNGGFVFGGAQFQPWTLPGGIDPMASTLTGVGRNRRSDSGYVD